eukprot:m.311132 g.311132  ORF g.311132 m.311132 type:complete len:418 (+) comp60622_c0_seq1:269-1522(+)
MSKLVDARLLSAWPTVPKECKLVVKSKRDGGRLAQERSRCKGYKPIWLRTRSADDPRSAFHFRHLQHDSSDEIDYMRQYRQDNAYSTAAASKLQASIRDDVIKAYSSLREGYMAYQFNTSSESFNYYKILLELFQDRHKSRAVQLVKPDLRVTTLPSIEPHYGVKRQQNPSHRRRQQLTEFYNGSSKPKYCSVPPGVSNLFLEVMHGYESESATDEKKTLPWRLPAQAHQIPKPDLEPKESQHNGAVADAGIDQYSKRKLLGDLNWNDIVDVLDTRSLLLGTKGMGQMRDGNFNGAAVVGTQMEVPLARHGPSRWRELENGALRWRRHRVDARNPAANSFSQPKLHRCTARNPAGVLAEAASFSKVLQSPKATNLALDIPESTAMAKTSLFGKKARLPSLQTKSCYDDFESQFTFQA